MTDREKFEQAYAEDNEKDVAWVISQRLSNGSYLDRYLSRAWYWWRRGWEAA
jgi:hypothetical protein